MLKFPANNFFYSVPNFVTLLFTISAHLFQRKSVIFIIYYVPAMIRSVDEILSEKFELEVIKDVLQSPTREKEKFFLAIQ